MISHVGQLLGSEPKMFGKMDLPLAPLSWALAPVVKAHNTQTATSINLLVVPFTMVPPHGNWPNLDDSQHPIQLIWLQEIYPATRIKSPPEGAAALLAQL
jgi:hypothetical protein